MSSRIIEIATDGYHLAVFRGFMTASFGGEEKTRIALDSIAAIIANAHGLTYSNNLLIELAKRGAVMVLCQANHNPAAFLWAVEGHHMQSARIEAQLQATIPKRKALWKQLIRSKIAQQAAILEALGKNDVPIKSLIQKVRSGDPDNIEAEAARRYWKIIFGKDFRRDRDSGGINGMLNYGYTVLRATVARSVMAAGLHPSIGLHHCNQYNSMRLVDDMIEPFRPFVDLAVFHLTEQDITEVNKESKRVLVELMNMEVTMMSHATALRLAAQDMASSLGMIFEGKAEKLELPLPQPPLWNNQQ